MSRSAIAKLGLVVVALLLVFGCQVPAGKALSDEELIRAAMAEWKAAREAKDLNRIMAAFSEKYVSADGTTNKDSMRDLFAHAIRTHRLDGVEANIENAEITIEGGKAMFGPIKLIGSSGSTVTFKYILQKEDGKWLIVGEER